MKIKSVTINKYKSITKPVTIKFDENLIVLIGKNGSGKSNILKALNIIFAQNIDYGYSRALDCEIKLKLSKAERDKLKNFYEYDGDDRTITVGLDKDAFYRKYKITNSQFDDKYPEKIKDINAQANKVEQSLKAYRKQMEDILKSSPDGLDQVSTLADLTGAIEDFNYYFDCDARLVEALLEYTKNAIKPDAKTSNRIWWWKSHYDQEHRQYKFKHVLELLLPDLGAVTKYFTIDKDGLQIEIDKVNTQLKAIDWTGLNKQFKQLIASVDDYIALTQAERDEYNRKENVRDEFWDQIQSVICNKSYSIPNDEVIFSNDDSYYREKDSVDSRYTQLLVESFIRLSYPDQADKMIDSYRGRSLNIDCKKFEEFLNRDIPTFDRHMTKGIKVETKDSRIKLSIVENSGVEVPFNSTSLGRRWFYTYYFLKQRLGKGDILILDEPASSLHPEAQHEILKDIEQVAKTHTVIMCTHSPYMISDSVKHVNMVRMDDNSTAVTSVNLDSLSSYKEEVGLFATNDLLLKLLGKTNIVCEGSKDVACLYAFMDYFKVRKNEYHIHSINGFPHFEMILDLYLNNGITMPIIILDADSKQETLRKKIHIKSDNANKTVKKLVEEGRVKLIFVGEGKQPDCIEGLFSEEDRAIFTQKQKVKNDIGELLTDRGCSPDTENNFRELFVQAGLLGKK